MFIFFLNNEFDIFCPAYRLKRFLDLFHINSENHSFNTFGFFFCFIVIIFVTGYAYKINPIYIHNRSHFACDECRSDSFNSK